MTPDDGFCVGIRVEVLLELSPGEGVELLDTSNGSVGVVVLRTVLVQLSVHLSGTDDDTLDLVVRLDLNILTLVVRWVRDDPLEVRVSGKVLDVRARERVTEQRFREEEDQSYRMLVCGSYSCEMGLTFPELSVHLSAEKMEGVGWRCAVSDLHVAVLVLAVELLW